MKKGDKVKFYIDIDLMSGEVFEVNESAKTVDVLTYMGLIQNVPITELI